MMVQAAASYGDQKPTGRNPGYFRWASPTTGSRSPTAGKPEPSTSSDRIRSSCGRTSAIRSGPGSAGLTISATTGPPSSCRARTPTVRQLPSTGKASSSTLAGVPAYDAGVNPSRNAMLAVSENGPRGTRVNVSMGAIPSPATDIYLTLTVHPAPAYDLIRHIRDAVHDVYSFSRPGRRRRPPVAHGGGARRDQARDPGW